MGQFRYQAGFLQGLLMSLISLMLIYQNNRTVIGVHSVFL